MGLSVKKWDFLFYAAFGLVVTSSVKVSGVLAVFSYLIVPIVCSTLLGRRGRGAALLGLGHRLRGLDPRRRFCRTSRTGRWAPRSCACSGSPWPIVSLSVRMKYVDDKYEGNKPVLEEAL